MRTVTIEKNGNNYTVNPNASSGGSLNMFNSTIPCYIPNGGGYHNSPTIILMLPDGTPTTIDNMSSVTKILCTGVVGGYQQLCYLDNDGGISEVPGFEDIGDTGAYHCDSLSYNDGKFYYTVGGDTYPVSGDTQFTFAELNLFTIMLSGFYGG